MCDVIYFETHMTSNILLQISEKNTNVSDLLIGALISKEFQH